jgi:hypothetical protein
MSFIIENLPESIKAAKAELRAALPQYKEVFLGVEAAIRKRVDEIVKERNSSSQLFITPTSPTIASQRILSKRSSRAAPA